MRRLLGFTTLLLLTGTTAYGAAILSPVAVVSNDAGTTCSGDDCSVERTIDHSGLLTGFTSGVTDFDTYMALAPLHSLAFLDQEWFSASPRDTASVVYDLGASYKIARLAYWNEDSNGVSSLSVFACSDAACTVATGLGAFSPTNNPINVNYPADVFDIADAATRYVRFDFTEFDDTNWIAVGELAFDAAAVPEPSSLLLFAAGLGVLARRRLRG